MWESRWVTSKPHRIARSTWARSSRRTSSRSAWSHTSAIVRGKPPSPPSKRRRHGDRTPAVQLPLGVQRQVHADVLAAVLRRGLAGPRAGHHQRRRGGHAVAQRRVHALVGRVAHAQVVAVDDQQPGVVGMTESLRERRHGPNATAHAAQLPPQHHRRPTHPSVAGARVEPHRRGPGDLGVAQPGHRQVRRAPPPSAGRRHRARWQVGATATGPITPKRLTECAAAPSSRPVVGRATTTVPAAAARANSAAQCG